MTTTLHLQMTLLSDGIFGSGFSQPGGADMGVCSDERGYPYLKGSTLKGLLRESLTNLLVWTGASSDTLDELLGIEGWNGTPHPRNIQLTGLTLRQPPSDAEQCYTLRTFTGVEGGIVKEGTLRSAQCICRGLAFEGELCCQVEDVPLLTDAVRAIKWAGTMRSRGFGRVQLVVAEGKNHQSRQTLKPTTCIHYKLRTELPVCITDYGRSHENSNETQGLIPGSSIRGMVLGHLAQENPLWFAQHEATLLSDGVRFLNTTLAHSNYVTLPAIKGFYEDKAPVEMVSSQGVCSTELESVLIKGTFRAGRKRAKLGGFCGVDGTNLCCYSTRTDGTMRIQRNSQQGTENTKIFQMRHICSGQEFEGYILLDDPTLAPELSTAFGAEVWLGTDRSAGYGKCSVIALDGDTPLGVEVAYGYHPGDAIDETLYLLALSPLAMVDGQGNPCGLDTDALAERLGVSSIQVLHCSTSVSGYGSYNRTLGCRGENCTMYDSGSLFRLSCQGIPSYEAIEKLQTTGLGMRLAEGYGRVLFLKKSLYEGISGKIVEREQERFILSAQAQLRRMKIDWVTAHVQQIQQCRLSNSQLGDIQSLCEGGDFQQLEQYFDKNLDNRGARHGSRFVKAAELVRGVINRPMSETLGGSCADTAEEKIALLTMLFNHSRKIQTKEGF